MKSVNDDLHLLATDAVLFPCEAALVDLSGEDRRDWLQGQVTQDLRKLEPWGSVKACLCTPTGQLLAGLTIWDLEDRFLVGTSRDCVDAFMRRAEEMVIMEDVIAKRLDQSLNMASVQGPTAGDHLEAAHLALAMDRSGYKGYDIWGVPQPTHLPSISAEAAEIARIEAGIPRYGTDMGPRTLPPEMGRAFIEAHISYTKGCYTGQEVLMRIHSRGHTNRTWVGLRMDGTVAAGDKVGDSGEVTSACVSPTFGPIALAMVRNESSETGASVMVGDVKGTVVELPFR